ALRDLHEREAAPKGSQMTRLVRPTDVRPARVIEYTHVTVPSGHELIARGHVIEVRPAAPALVVVGSACAVALGELLCVMGVLVLCVSGWVAREVGRVALEAGTLLASQSKLLGKGK
ncbi:MAG: hypothetical protein JXB36_02990, partial [Gammaproteobacteria bacterium]|nr:hypothetical protein [Gammaproteobacteria bacterium]